ncbi:hypothetical protein BCR43DRAFT_76675 [Syncephalastrum racemosum]|uniref:Uncharacterized protein n=1 Tax=Syncephalastrum racemosum TaxID=13706 RepID=A0A1X2H2E6_SYNRA|nr:hypothetical protein BCR43DRAFT_76675 [Syncephalastrum racemosum]
MAALEKQIKERDARLKQIELDAKQQRMEREARIEQLEDEVEDLKDEKAALELEVSMAEEKNQKLASLEEKETTIKKQDELLKHKDALIQDKERVIQEKDALIQDKDMVIKEKDAMIQRQESLLKRMQELASDIAKQAMAPHGTSPTSSSMAPTTPVALEPKKRKQQSVIEHHGSLELPQTKRNKRQSTEGPETAPSNPGRDPPTPDSMSSPPAPLSRAPSRRTSDASQTRSSSMTPPPPPLAPEAPAQSRNHTSGLVPPPPAVAPKADGKIKKRPLSKLEKFAGIRRNTKCAAAQVKELMQQKTALIAAGTAFSNRHTSSAPPLATAAMLPTEISSLSMANSSQAATASSSSTVAQGKAAPRKMRKRRASMKAFEDIFKKYPAPAPKAPTQEAQEEQPIAEQNKKDDKKDDILECLKKHLVEDVCKKPIDQIEKKLPFNSGSRLAPSRFNALCSALEFFYHHMRTMGNPVKNLSQIPEAERWGENKGVHIMAHPRFELREKKMAWYLYTLCATYKESAFYTKLMRWAGDQVYKTLQTGKTLLSCRFIRLMSMLAVSAHDEAALRVLCYDIPSCTPLKDAFFLPLLNVVLMAKGILKLKDPASEEDPVCEIIPKVIQSVTAEHCKSENAGDEGRAVYAIMAEFNDWPTLDNAKPINARLDEVVVLLREHGDSLKELMDTKKSFYSTLKSSMVRSVRLACIRHSSWKQVYNHYVREQFWPFLARGDLKPLAMELIGAAVELGIEAKGNRKKTSTEQKGVTFIRDSIHALLAQRIPLTADDAKTVAAGAMVLLRMDKHNPDRYQKDIDMIKAWIDDKHTRCVRYFLDVNTRKTLMNL